MDRHSLTPEALYRPPAFTNVMVVESPARTIFVGGQNAGMPDHPTRGKGDLKTQARLILRNVQTALTAAGATLDHLVKCNVYIVQGQPLYHAFEAFQSEWGQRPEPPTVTVLFVAGLAHPDVLMEMDAVAVVPR
ncbi:Enamine deaminase RidA, house cleaning of reactive enamine intermediates, YjgF/YER057c/UK114 family [Catalinimonas alkaloidigena]|uniref:Enamine deaminase RidA, house cleaning of reactive enamine intermediates, YjgF/YER057c/UK114 family n=1 Tax=Catalinimonas alkaloidigena TaxID=1075417 RepID=A0A1G8Y4J9_9BACT|nr:RidA family protein [Catalinimonas alkaloidigena]SDJ97075.1 Enamine deaminase RidA, house cleaning of reactive enamine intermediates, YjgF/YER057c/UK114 family [Catalinimonas alkaloidigena]